MFSGRINLFRNTTIKMTSLYLGIIMIISLFFSFSIYQISIREIERGFTQQDRALRGTQPIRELISDRDFIDDRLERLETAKVRLLLQLVYTNLVILVFGGGLSYVLARKTLQPIEEFHAAQQRFTADASHELRTPLTAMKTEIEVALRETSMSKPQFKTLLTSNLDEIAKLTSLSDGLLSLARMETKDMDFKQVKINEVIEAAVKRVSVLAKSKNIVIQSSEIEPRIVAGDKASLIDTIVTLLDNAIKYSPINTSIKITQKTNQKNIIILISDEGSGIKAGELPHIFERFYRADSSRTKGETAGYGLGLSIAKTTIEKHRGKLSIKSQPTKGTTVTIQLPKL